MAIFEIFNAVLKKATEVGASDIHISAGGPFRLRIKGEVVPVQSTGVLKPQDTATIAAEILIASKKVDREQVQKQIDSLTDFDCSAHALPEVGRFFGANICSQRGSLALGATHDSVQRALTLTVSVCHRC